MGSYSVAEFPDQSREIWLDDGYFEKQPAERTSMPIHNHPGTEYVKRHFNEPLGAKTYYIVEANGGANTHGFNEDASLEEWNGCAESREKQIDTELAVPLPTGPPTGDFLIPKVPLWPWRQPDGSRNILLEMRQENTLLGYDFMRPTWMMSKER